MSGVITYADVFVICSANNRRQVKGIAEAVLEVAKRDYGRLPEGVEGLEASRWVLVDLGDVIIHVFDEPLRGFYDLDRLWGDARRLPSPEVEFEDQEEAEALPQ
jgi:ribosome-associated protein